MVKQSSRIFGRANNVGANLGLDSRQYFSKSGFGAARQSPLNNQGPSAKSAIVTERLGQIQRRPGTELAQDRAARP
jgi:hypothetical protein